MNIFFVATRAIHTNQAYNSNHHGRIIFFLFISYKFIYFLQSIQYISEMKQFNTAYTVDAMVHSNIRRYHNAGKQIKLSYAKNNLLMN